MNRSSHSWEKWWEDKDRGKLKRVSTPKEAFLLAELIIDRMALQTNKPIGLVCGALANLDPQEVDRNFARFNSAIENLTDAGHIIFSQIPFEDFFREWATDWMRCNDDEYPYPILSDFYAPIIRRGLVAYQCFIPNWHTSFGAQWERCEGHAAHNMLFDLNDNHQIINLGEFNEFTER